jgi:hypothetical protein
MSASIQRKEYAGIVTGGVSFHPPPWHVHIVRVPVTLRWRVVDLLEFARRQLTFATVAIGRASGVGVSKATEARGGFWQNMPSPRAAAASRVRGVLYEKNRQT